jgi:hypothetical protein
MKKRISPGLTPLVLYKEVKKEGIPKPLPPKIGAVKRQLFLMSMVESQGPGGE